MSNRQKAALSKQLIRKLGRQTDKSLAAEFGIPTVRIARERRQRQIPAFQLVDWTPEKIAVLGTMSESDAAGVIGVSRSAVFAKRVSLGIPPFMESPLETRFQWTAPQIRKLGKVSDSRLAKELGISASVVSSKRYSLGISPSGSTSRVTRPWSARERAMLGRKPDTVVSAETGRGRRHVRSKRESLGIPPFQQQTSIEWTKTLKRRLGTIPDAELAKELGVTLQTVALHRRGFGIQAYRRGGKAPSGRSTLK